MAQLDAHSWVSLTVFAVTVALCIRPVQVWRVRLDLASAPALAVLLLLCTTSASPQDVLRGVAGGGDGIVPYAILVLVFSLALLCIAIDETGLFRWVAWLVAKNGGSSGRKLFFNFYVLSAVLTFLTSNDVVVLTVTPILIYFTRSAKIDPAPYLMSSFWVCNIASMGLYIGNPTNVIVAQANNINVLEYTKLMGIPTLVACILAFLIALALFWKSIPQFIDPPSLSPSDYAVEDVVGAWFGSVCLGASLVLLMTMPLVVSNLSVWILTLPFAAIVLLRTILVDVIPRASSPSTNEPEILTMPPPSHFIPSSTAEGAAGDSSEFLVMDQPASETQTTADRLSPSRAFKALKTRFPKTTTLLARLPMNLVPFTFGMFILVETLTSRGWTSLLATALAKVSYSRASAIFAIGGIATLACNALNNLPMTILFTRALGHPNFVAGIQAYTSDTAQRQKEAQFALVVGANLGANVLYLGSLAGIMWIDLVLRRYKVQGINQWKFFRWCMVVTPVILAGACAVLLAEMGSGAFV
ncbi:arsenical pump membrane protein-domain-containing protein [Chytriomyces cf. hyalinus JEL632]|nr:arsenical pump membrane protein-domain-containing protein [Chytriomyces cf. hyalinus JEL632]